MKATGKEEVFRAWSYSRLSRDEDEEQNSLENQKRLVREYIDSNGHIYIGESSDDNRTGMNFDRSGIDEIYDEVEKGTIDAVVVKDLSRLGRHRTQTALFIEYLLKNHVRVLSVTENIDTSDENDDLVIGIKQVLNDFYCKDTSRKIRSGYHQKQKKGLVLTPPFGYFKDKNTNEIQIVDECAEIVRLIFELYQKGLGYKKIAQHLSNHGFGTPSLYANKILGKRVGGNKTKYAQSTVWHDRTVERILSDPAYIGTLVCHKSETSKIRKTFRLTKEDEQIAHENFLPPIVDKQLWEEVQTLKKIRDCCPVRASHSSIVHRYAGLLRCEDCNSTFTCKTRKLKNQQWFEYVCTTYHRLGNRYCTPHRIREEDLDQLLQQEILSLKFKAQSNWKKIEAFITACTKQKSTNQKRIAVYEKQIGELQEEIKRLVRKAAMDEAHEDLLYEIIDEDQKKIASLQAQIADAKQSDMMSSKKREGLKTSIALLDDIVKNGAILDSNVRLLVESIIIKETEEKLDIQFDLRAPFQSHKEIYDTFCRLEQETVPGDENYIAGMAETVNQITATA